MTWDQKAENQETYYKRFGLIVIKIIFELSEKDEVISDVSNGCFSGIEGRNKCNISRKGSEVLLYSDQELVISLLTSLKTAN